MFSQFRSLLIASSEIKTVGLYDHSHSKFPIRELLIDTKHLSYEILRILVRLEKEIPSSRLICW